MSKSFLIPILSALTLASGCPAGPSNTGTNNNGNGNGGIFSLEIQSPPGRSVGIEPGQSVTLRIRYANTYAVAEASREVHFTLEGDAGGATLAGFSAWTDDAGVAEMRLTAGSSAASFKVVVSAANALDVSFEVAVSEGGFTGIEVMPQYVGSRGEADFAMLNADLYMGLSCAELGPVVESFPDRSRQTDAGFGALMHFENLPANEDYAISVRATASGGALLAWGCAELDHTQLVPGADQRLYVGADDVSPTASGTYELTTRVDLSNVDPAQLAAPLEPLRALGHCPQDPWQRLLDCLADAASPDGTLDCVPTGQDDFAIALELSRGVKDPQGCRGALNGLGLPGLEAQLADLADATALQWATALRDISALDLSELQTLEIVSELTIVPPAEGDTHFMWHRLQTLAFPDFAPDLALSLGQLGNSLLEAASMPADLALGDPPSLGLPTHALTLHPGWAALAATWDVHLGDVGAPPTLDALVNALVAHLSLDASPVSPTGCAALQTLIELAIAGTTAVPAGLCHAGLDLLLDVADDAWTALPSVDSQDTNWTADVPLWDPDFDLDAEGIGEPGAPTPWQLELRVGDDWITPAAATFSATTLPIP